MKLINDQFKFKEWIVTQIAFCIIFSFLASMGISPAWARDFCSQAAEAVHKACNFEAKDDLWLAKANCINTTPRRERIKCESAALKTQEDALEECQAQKKSRIKLCAKFGEARYQPAFDPANFVDPAQIGVSIQPNPYLPLIAGTRWVYSDGKEIVTDTVTTKTKLINGVTCRVVTDVVEKEGMAIEITDDWYAQDRNGNVWYCGEVSQDLETFQGDTPQEAELVSMDGSWKAGRDGSKPGIFILANPKVGDTYRQEVSYSEAEDAAEVLSITGTESVTAASCSGNCLVTSEFTPLSPGVKETKVYAPGVGLILEVSADGERLELIEFHRP